MHHGPATVELLAGYDVVEDAGITRSVAEQIPVFRVRVG